MFGWNKTEKHNQYSPHKPKSPERIQFPIFHSEIWLQSMICVAPQDGTVLKTQPLESLRSHLWEDCGPWWINAWLLGRMSDLLSVLQSICPRCRADRAAEPTEHGEPECDCGRRLGPCAFSWVTHPGPRRGKGERALLGRGAGWAPNVRWRVRLLSPHLGKYKVSKILPNYRKKPVGFTVDTVMLNAVTGWSSKAHQCPIPSIKHSSRKNLPIWLFFGEGWRKWLFFKPGGFFGEVEAWVQVSWRAAVSQVSGGQFGEW